MPLFGTRGAASVTGFGGLAKLGYLLRNSLRFRASNSAYLSRTPAGAGNQKTWTWSGWVKRGVLGSASTLISGGGTTGRLALFFNGSDQLEIDVGGTGSFQTSTAVFRDPAAWYHVVWAFDTTQGTGANRSRIYVNGTELSLTQTRTFTQNTDYAINGTGIQTHGTLSNSIGGYNFDGYLTEINFVNAQQLTPSSFGKTDAVTGQWIPIKYGSTYGTNGFYLKFDDSSAVGKDSSGNGNNWSTSGHSVTPGVTYDLMTDVPTLTSATAANYGVFNAVSAYSDLPIINANIQTSAVPSGSDWYSRSTTMGFSSGKIYAEFSMPSITSGSQGSPVGFGIIPSTTDFSASGQLVGDANRGYGFYCPDTSGSETPKKRVAGTSTSVGTASATITTDTFMVAFDLTNGNGWFGKNGTWYAGDPAAGTGASITGITAREYIFGLSLYRDTTFTNNTAAINFGQRPFAYTPPSGFKSLNAYNLP